MDTSMASSLPTEKMHQYLLGHGYWSYVEGANDTTLESTQRFPGVGTIGEHDIILFWVLCGRTAIELCSGCENAKGCVGESEEDFRREHYSQEAVEYECIMAVFTQSLWRVLA